MIQEGHLKGGRLDDERGGLIMNERDIDDGGRLDDGVGFVDRASALSYTQTTVALRASRFSVVTLSMQSVLVPLNRDTVDGRNPGPL